MPFSALLRVASSLVAALAVAFALAAVPACAGRGGRPEPSPGSFLWVAAEDAAALTAEEVAALERSGIGRLVLEAGTLGADGRPEIEPVAFRSMAASHLPAVRLPVLLAVSGSWDGSDDPPEAGVSLAEGLTAVRRRAEAAGWRPVGFLLDLALPADEESLEGFAALLETVAEEAGGGALLGVTVDPAVLGSPGVESIAEAADLLVAFLYGPRPDGGPAAEGDAAWSVEAAGEGARRLDGLGTPFLVGVGTVGELVRLDRSGAAAERTTRADLASLLAAPGLSAPRAPVLEGLDRQRYELTVQEPLAVGGWRLPAGSAFAVQRLTVHHLDAFLAHLAELGLSRHLGQVWMRPPRAGEGLAVPVAALTEVAAGRPPGPRLELALEERSARRGRRVVRVTLSNPGGEATEIASFDANRVELTTPSGAFVRVDPGDFRRYELTRGGRRVADARSASRADGLRLYAPRLAAGETLTSGDVEVRGGRGVPRIEATATFLAPGGERVEAVAGDPAETAPCPDPSPPSSSSACGPGRSTPRKARRKGRWRCVPRPPGLAGWGSADRRGVRPPPAPGRRDRDVRQWPGGPPFTAPRCSPAPGGRGRGGG